MILPMEKARENATLVIAASLIAVVRLRGEPIKPSPKFSAQPPTQFSFPAWRWQRWRGECEDL